MLSDSESDDEYVPGEPEQVSEEESADDETDLQYQKELEHKATKKRKSASSTKGTKKRKTRNGAKEPRPEPEKKIEVEEDLDPVEEEKREEDLWAKFLEGTPKTVSKVTSTSNEPAKSVTVADKLKPEAKTVKESSDDNKAREKRIFEFAGETIVVENNVIKEKIKTAEAPAAASALVQSSARPRTSAGLSSIVGQLNRKDKLSTLEKSKLDWTTFKQEEGLDEEIESHNKGKSGYLDRRDFLERADLRQYEIERDLRMSRRSNR